MTAVVTDTCADCRFTECVKVCPVGAFHIAPDRVFVNPSTCIDCMACVPACPIQSIYMDPDLPADKSVWVELNRKGSQEWPQITEGLEPLPTAAAKKQSLGF